jgi:hypothetical protein
MLTSVRLEEKSLAACALTSWWDRIHLCWVGTDAKLNLASSSDGREFAVTRTLPHRVLSYRDSDSNYVVTAPALAGAPEHLYLSWTGTDTRVAVLCDGHRELLRAHRAQTPGLRVARGGGVRIGRPGVGLGRQEPTGEPADPVREPRDRTCPVGTGEKWVAPALCGHRGALVLAWVGTDRRVNVLTLQEHGPGTHLRLVEARTGDRPAICSHQGAVLVAWTGTDRRVNLMTVNENRVTVPVRLDEARSVVGPAVCSHRGRLVLAWTGTDARLNVAHLSGA